MIKQFRDLISYRELLFSLTKKELKVKYRGSFLGFFWSLLNPILIMLVYSFVFSIVLRQGIKEFSVFLLCALLPFNFFSNSVNYGSGSVISNANLVKKIYGGIHLTSVHTICRLLNYERLPQNYYGI